MEDFIQRLVNESIRSTLNKANEVSWLCNCKLTNASINNVCGGISNFTNVQHYQITPSRYDWTLYAVRDWRFKELTDNEDKFAQFFNAEVVLVSAMTEVELIEHIEELESIAFEAKARLTAAKTNSRDRAGKKFAGGDWSITQVQPDQTVSDSINKVKLRSARMSKLDKTRAKLEALGLEDKEIDRMISVMLKQARKDPASPENSASNGDSSAAMAKPIIKPFSPVVPIQSEVKPLDLSKLKFK